MVSENDHQVTWDTANHRFMELCDRLLFNHIKYLLGVHSVLAPVGIIKMLSHASCCWSSCGNGNEAKTWLQYSGEWIYKWYGNIDKGQSENDDENKYSFVRVYFMSGTTQVTFFFFKYSLHLYLNSHHFLVRWTSIGYRRNTFQKLMSG